MPSSVACRLRSSPRWVTIAGHTDSQLADVWGRPQTYTVVVAAFSIGYAMTAGAQNISTVVAGQLIYTFGNAGITICECASTECCDKTLCFPFLPAIQALTSSEQSNHRRHHLLTMASLRQRCDQLAVRRQRVRRIIHHGRDQWLQLERLEMGRE